MAHLSLDEAILGRLRIAPASGKALAKALRRDHGRVMAVCRRLAATGAIQRRGAIQCCGAKWVIPENPTGSTRPAFLTPAAAAAPRDSRGLATRAPDSGPEPEFYVGPGGRRVTEADVIEALWNMGDEQVAAYREGRLSKLKAYRIARNSLRTLAEMRTRPVYRSPYRREP